MCGSLPLSGDDPPRLAISLLVSQVRIDSLKPYATADDGAQVAVLKMEKGEMPRCRRSSQEKGFALGHAYPWRLGAHMQPAIDAIGLCVFSGYASAFLIENVNCAPHAKTVRAYSISMSSLGLKKVCVRLLFVDFQVLPLSLVSHASREKIPMPCIY